MKYGEKDDGWRTKGRIKSFEVDFIGKLTIEIEKYYIGTPKLEDFGGIEIPKWLSKIPFEFKGAERSPSEGYGTIVIKGEAILMPPAAPGDERTEKERRTEVAIDISLERTPLTMHPKIQEFMDIYGGTFDGNELTWVTEDPTKVGGKGKSGVDKDGKTVMNINPFYGLQDYLEVGVTASITSTNEDLYDEKGWVTERLKKVGKIDIPDDLIPPAPTGRSWLCTEATQARQGQGGVTTQRWQLSGNGGWQKLIYTPNRNPIPSAI